MTNDFEIEHELFSVDVDENDDGGDGEKRSIYLLIGLYFDTFDVVQ